MIRYLGYAFKALFMINDFKNAKLYGIVCDRMWRAFDFLTMILVMN